MNFKKILAVLSIFAILITGCSKTNESNITKTNHKAKDKSIIVYSGAGLRKPMEQIGVKFKEKTGIKVNYNYAGNAQLLSQMELSQEGDVFISGGTVDMEKAKEKQFIFEYKKVAYHVPVIGVPKGNPAKISELGDLTKPGIKVIIGDEKANAIGKLAVLIFKKNNILSEVEKNIVAKDATVNEVVIHTAMKQCDASIITGDSAAHSKDIETIEIPELQNEIETIPVGVLSFSKQSQLAQQFVDFVSSKEGREIFVNNGFAPIK